MEKNIRKMSETYLETVRRALYAKKEKNIQEYWLYSGQADELFDYHFRQSHDEALKGTGRDF